MWNIYSRSTNFQRRGNEGFSIIELLIVVAIITVMMAVSLPYFYNYKKLFKSEEQALKVIDAMRETGQLALNRRRTFRMEVDITTNTVRIIDENGSDPDTLYKSIPLESTGTVRMDAAPSPVSIGRPNPPNYAAAQFKVDTHGHMVGGTQVIGNTVFDLHFRSDGAVVTDADIPISATLFFYPPTSASSDTPTDTKQVRAITLYGGSGTVRYWRYNGTTFAAQ